MDQDGVLAVGREGGAVAVQDVQQRRQHGLEQGLQPGAGGHARPLHQGRGHRCALAVAVQQRRHGHGPLTLLELAVEALPPDAAEQLPVLVGGAGQGLVLGVGHGQAGHLAEQDQPPVGAQERVGGHDAGEELGHPGGGQRPVGGQAPPDQGVEDAHGQLEVVAARGGAVGQGADRLLGQVLVGPLAEGDQVAGGQAGREQGHDHVLPLPVVHREPEVVTGVGAGGGQGGGEAAGGGRVELAGQEPVVGEPRDRLVGGDPGPGGQPVQPHRGPPLRGVAQVVGVAEPEAALVGGDPGVAAHLALDLVVVQLQQAGGGDAPGGQVAVGQLGGPQLFDQVGGGGGADPGGRR